MLWKILLKKWAKALNSTVLGELPRAGYLVGTLDRFNNAKKKEVEDRVKHGVSKNEK